MTGKNSWEKVYGRKELKRYYIVRIQMNQETAKYLSVFIVLNAVLIGVAVGLLWNLDRIFLGEIITAIVAFVSVILIYFQYLESETSKKKEKYNQLLSILFELKLAITRCEGYMSKWHENTDPNSHNIHFNKIILHNFKNEGSNSQMADINPEIYNSIKIMYSAIEVIKETLKQSEVVQYEKREPIQFIFNDSTNQEGQSIVKKNVTDIIAMSKIDGARYGVMIAFIKYYLKDMYRNFNFALRVAKKYAQKHSLGYPNSLKEYTLQYVIERPSKWELQDGKLDSH